MGLGFGKTVPSGMKKELASVSLLVRLPLPPGIPFHNEGTSPTTPCHGQPEGEPIFEFCLGVSLEAHSLLPPTQPLPSPKVCPQSLQSLCSSCPPHYSFPVIASQERGQGRRWGWRRERARVERWSHAGSRASVFWVKWPALMKQK